MVAKRPVVKDGAWRVVELGFGVVRSLGVASMEAGVPGTSSITNAKSSEPIMGALRP